ncbi:hypothetical protein PsalN5692_00973 [Piscirickettsia salmonis]|uniref:hypothetical protein n=1 Tax=Piscirickettsia salmonis TaxID=1238 RepID=UPI0012B9BA77|nr:hypothetical protein [Piscirickettsia salmonis]QGP49528.1 hypothetical protein PsalN5692_00973 [Piscirickettsia salmonis]
MTLEQWWNSRTPAEKSMVAAIIASLNLQIIEKNILAAQKVRFLDYLREQLANYSIEAPDLDDEEAEEAADKIQKLLKEEPNLQLDKKPEQPPQAEGFSFSDLEPKTLAAMSREEFHQLLLSPRQIGIIVTVGEILKKEDGFDIFDYQVNNGPKLDAQLTQIAPGTPTPDTPIKIEAQFRCPLRQSIPLEEQEEEKNKQAMTLAQLVESACAINQAKRCPVRLNVQAEEHEVSPLAQAFICALQRRVLLKQLQHLSFNNQVFDYSHLLPDTTPFQTQQQGAEGYASSEPELKQELDQEPEQEQEQKLAL